MKSKLQAKADGNVIVLVILLIVVNLGYMFLSTLTLVNAIIGNIDSNIVYLSITLIILINFIPAVFIYRKNLGGSWTTHAISLIGLIIIIHLVIISNHSLVTAKEITEPLLPGENGQFSIFKSSEVSNESLHYHWIFSILAPAISLGIINSSNSGNTWNKKIIVIGAYLVLGVVFVFISNFVIKATFGIGGF